MQLRFTALRCLLERNAATFLVTLDKKILLGPLFAYVSDRIDHCWQKNFGHTCKGSTFGIAFSKDLRIIIFSAHTTITVLYDPLMYFSLLSWWRHQMETFSALLAICAGNSPVPGEFPTQRPVTRSFDDFFDLRLNKRLSKQSWGWWLETLSRPLWRHRNGSTLVRIHLRAARVITGWRNGLSPAWRQAITLSNDGLLSVES